MQPKQQRRDQFTPKWRHFHPQSKLYVKNPFDEDIEFQVADDQNVPWLYKMPGKKVSELPGGPIATLGLKHIVDKMIGESKSDAIRIWEPTVREAYEAQVIVKVIEAPQIRDKEGPTGPIDLAIGEDDATDTPVEPVKKEEQAFPDARPTEPEQRTAAVGAPPLSTAGIGDTPQIVEDD